MNDLSSSSCEARDSKFISPSMESSLAELFKKERACRDEQTKVRVMDSELNQSTCHEDMAMLFSGGDSCGCPQPTHLPTKAILLVERQVRVPTGV